MKITVQNFRGCKRADIADEQVSLVGGHNGEGKTSVLLAAACALSGITAPLGLRKTDGGALVHTGASGAAVIVETPDGSARVDWPKGERATTGEPPFASPVAVGLESPAEIPVKDRPTYFGELLKTDPTREDFDAALKAAGIATDDDLPKFDKVWATVQRDGWAAAHTRAQEAGREQKGAWGQVTKETWGQKKAESWQPEGWGTELASASLSSLDDAVTAARAETEFHVGRQAIAEDEIERMTAQAAAFDERKVAADEARAAGEKLKSALAEIKAEIVEIGERDDRPGLPCPHCGEGVRLVRVSSAETKLEKATPIDRAVLEKRRAAFSAADGKRAGLEAQISAARAVYEAAHADFAAAEEAKSRLAEGASADGSAQADVDRAREAERAAIAARDAFKAKVEADRIHRSIMRNAEMVRILSPEGVRHTVLTRALAAFNGKLAAICAAARFAPVTLTDRLAVEYDGRAYALASASEQFRCRVALQIACADADGSEAVIVDGADILDAGSRGGFLSMLAKRGGRALVGMTLTSREKAPDLARLGIGSVYWIENGIFTGNERVAA